MTMSSFVEVLLEEDRGREEGRVLDLWDLKERKRERGVKF